MSEISAVSKNVQVVPIAEYEAVKAAMAGYIEGLTVGSFDRVTDSFWGDASMHGFTPAGLTEGSYENLKLYVDEFGAGPDSRCHLDVLAITPSTAVVRVELEDAADGGDYTDFHTLIKKDGTWKVIAKVFHQYGI